MDNKKKYWKGLAQLNDDPKIKKLAENEFSEQGLPRLSNLQDTPTLKPTPDPIRSTDEDGLL